MEDSQGLQQLRQAMDDFSLPAPSAADAAFVQEQESAHINECLTNPATMSYSNGLQDYTLKLGFDWAGYPWPSGEMRYAFRGTEDVIVIFQIFSLPDLSSKSALPSL